MNKEKISSQDIIDLLASKASVSKRASEEFLKVLIASIEDALLASDIVKIKNFGTFKLHWNEARKSVNVQTGEEIILAGYHKVVFVPDTTLKDVINEPFAHLDAVELDIDKNVIATGNNENATVDPLRIFAEQASEIKNLLSEIQALSPTRKVDIAEKEVDKPIQNNQKPADVEAQAELKIKEHEQVEIPKEIEQDNENEIINDYKRSPKLTETSIEENSKSEILSKEKKTKKQRWRLLTIIIMFLFISGSVGLYYFYRPANEMVETTIDTCKIGFKNLEDNASFSEMLHNFTKWLTPNPKTIPVSETVVIPKNTDSIVIETDVQAVDSLQLLFDTPRVYKVFVASERIKVGSRLALMAKRYYGTSDFWVYIYEANNAKILNPDKIAVGTLIHIPKLDSRLIDATNPRCIKKALELHELYVKPTKSDS